jgi:hypothetical protein
LTQAFLHPTWRPTWHKNGTKPLGQPKGIGSRFEVAQFLNMGPIDSSSFLPFKLGLHLDPRALYFETQLWTQTLQNGGPIVLINRVGLQCKGPLTSCFLQYVLPTFSPESIPAPWPRAALQSTRLTPLPEDSNPTLCGIRNDLST